MITGVFRGQGTQFWDQAGWPTTSEWQVYAAGAAVLVGIIAAGIALWQLRAFFRAQWEQNRPYVLVGVVYANGMIEIEVVNPSANAALDVTIKPDRPFESTSDALAQEINERLNGTFTFKQLSPGRRYRYDLDGIMVFDRDLPKL